MLARRTSPATVQSAHIPAPMRGMNTIAPAGMIPRGQCHYAYNLLASENGLRSRLGWVEWATGLTGSSNNAVRTMLPFQGSSLSGSTNRLFNTTSTGIWDVTASTSTPTQVLTFASSAGSAGRGISCVYVTSAGHFLLYADEENGLHYYAESTDTWSVVAQGAGPTQIDGVNPINIASVGVWKTRVFLVEKDTARAWYLAAGVVYGTATAFQFGTKFRAGGSLVGLWNWTYDGGNGIDDALVAVSRGGDVAIYLGSDPSSMSTFSLKGVWYLGGVTAGRRISTPFGGDVLLSSQTGLIPLSKLVTGTVDSNQYTTKDVANLYSQLATLYRGFHGWAVYVHPTDNALIVTIPSNGEDQASTQLAMSLSTGGWSRYRDLPIVSAEVWDGELYFGTADGRVCRNSGYLDGVLLSNSGGTAIDYSLLTRFENLGNAQMKRMEWLRADILSEATNPDYEIKARYRYNMTEISAPSGTGIGTDGWDYATWDSGVWDGGASASQTIRGATGMGREVAVALRGKASSKTTIVGVDAWFNMGGPR